jgi:hypothetical protein
MYAEETRFVIQPFTTLFAREIGRIPTAERRAVPELAGRNKQSYCCLSMYWQSYSVGVSCGTGQTVSQAFPHHKRPAGTSVWLRQKSILRTESKRF